MQKFIRKTLWFILVLVLYFGVNTGVNYVIMINTKAHVDRSNILIVGDSHLQKALNPELFKSAQNICQLAEPYILTYWKLQKVLPLVASDTVLIGFAHNNISAYNDLKFSRQSWASEMFKRSYAIQNYQGLTGIKVDYSELLRVLWKRFCVYPELNHHRYVGHYTNSPATHISDSSLVIKRHYYDGERMLGVSETAVSYLDSIIEICMQHGATPILISSPVHNSYFKGIPMAIKDRFNEIRNQLTEKGIWVIDHTTSYYPDSLYLNADHINSIGATRFSKEIIEMFAIP